MSKLIFIVLFSIASVIASAKENVTVVYSWTAADGPANYSRAIIEEANRLQNKYNFVFDEKFQYYIGYC
jgi:hypothetical protein